MDDSLPRLWAKTAPYPGTPERWHPLLLHLLDVAAAADAILAREPEATRNHLASLFGMEWSAARPWLLLLVGAHDIGKACASFQSLYPLPLDGSALATQPRA